MFGVVYYGFWCMVVVVGIIVIEQVCLYQFGGQQYCSGFLQYGLWLLLLYQQILCICGDDVSIICGILGKYEVMFVKIFLFQFDGLEIILLKCLQDVCWCVIYVLLGDNGFVVVCQVW